MGGATPRHSNVVRSAASVARMPAALSCKSCNGIERGGHNVSKQTSYEGLKSSCRRWHGDMTDIADQR